MARVAVVSGTATAVSNNVSRRQAEKWSAQDQQAAAQAPQPIAAGGDDTVEQLQKLAALKEQGILTQEEFDSQKAKILGS